MTTPKKKAATRTKKTTSDHVTVVHAVDNSDRITVATHILTALVEEEDWDEDEEPTADELAKTIGKTWIDNELRAQLRRRGQSYAMDVYDRLDHQRHNDHRSAITAAAVKRVQELYPKE